ncbi:structural maintenance of chromosome 3 [Artemisia annua]|uniref:Structural maintenance of chromosomes protein 4 n=1 Tax=Artemisia annua TaxID=35608 RepID=A0A2U1LQA7_ARTAN|nr:structural maintenance of chromosome 3 [Artemisia annua]
MKPKAQGSHDEGFLEYLEDIIGTNKYLEHINESHKQLESLNEKRTEVLERVKLADKEKDKLESVKNEAEDYMLKKLSLLKCQEKALNFALEDNDTKKGDIQMSVSGLEESLASERRKIDESKKELNELEMSQNMYMKRQVELDSQLKRCKDELKECEKQDDKHQNGLKRVKQKVKNLEEKIVKDSAQITKVARQSKESATLITKLQEDNVKLQQNYVDEDSILEELKKNSKVETEPLRTEIADVRAKLNPWEKQLIVHQGELKDASNKKNDLCEKHEAGHVAYMDAQKRLDDIHMRLVTKTSSIKDMQTKLDKNIPDLEKARKLNQEKEALLNLEQAARQKVTELKSVMESERNQGNVLNSILQAKASNAIQGIYGRLGDLGAIDAKYDVAISTACPGLDNILVETTAVAKACVKILRKNNIGRATFIVLKELDHMQDEKVSTPEGVPRLFDLIKVQDEKLKRAFFQVMGNTVVAKDNDQGKRIAYGVDKAWRVVTLNGVLFETSGTMSGGGRTPRRGKMGTSIKSTSVSRESVIKAENELTQIVEKLKHAQQQVSELVRHHEKLAKATAILKTELSKSQIEIEELNSQHENLAKQLDSLKAEAEQSEDDLHRLEELTNIILEEEKNINKLTQDSKQLKDKELELQNRIDNAGGERLKSQQAKVNKIQNDIDKNSTEISRHEVQIETGDTRINELKNEIEKSKKEKDRVIAQEENLFSTLTEINQRSLKVDDEYKTTQQLINQHKGVLGKAKSDYEKLKKTVNELQASEIDVVDKLQDMKRMLKELEMKSNDYKKKLEAMNAAFSKHMEQITKDQVDPQKLQDTLGDEFLAKCSDLETMLERVALLEAQMEKMNPNLNSISDYREKVSKYNERVEELTLVTKERDETKKHYDGWRKKRLEEFMAGFNIISLKLKEVYQMITLGGDAELELVDSLDPFSEGVVFSVRPPKKSWKNIGNLSGGEKTLSSLALVFALHHYKPSPLYVMDEIDAALDFRNVSIVGHYVKDCTKDAQFIIISLRNNMFELADRLVGIYKTDNCTKSLTIDPRGFVVHEKGA